MIISLLFHVENNSSEDIMKAKIDNLGIESFVSAAASAI